MGLPSAFRRSTNEFEGRRICDHAVIAVQATGAQGATAETVVPESLFAQARNACTGETDNECATGEECCSVKDDDARCVEAGKCQDLIAEENGPDLTNKLLQAGDGSASCSGETDDVCATGEE